MITICGRAGSKGVKNKNVRELLGISLIKYTIGSAYIFREGNPGYNIDICVNSDSRELLNMANQYDLTCIERPEELAQDASPKVPVLQHSVEYMEKYLDKRYDYIIDLDITSPLRKETDITNVLNKLVENADNDVVFSVVPSRRNPYFNMVENKNGKMQKVVNASYTARQQAPKVYDMNGSIYCYRRDSLLNVLERSPFDGVFDIVLMKDTAVLDIDCERDWELMGVLAKYFFDSEFKELYEYTINM